MQKDWGRIGLWMGFAGILFSALWLTAQGTGVIAEDDYAVASITPLEAKSLIERGALVIDVRKRGSFDEQHIPGALSMPVEILRTEIPAIVAGVLGRPIIVYCASGSGRGPEGTWLLNRAGFAGAVNLESGIEGWRASGQPLTRSDR